MQWVWDPSQSIADNLNNVRHEVSRYFRGGGRHFLELELRNLKQTVRTKRLGTCIGALVTLRRGTSLDVI